MVNYSRNSRSIINMKLKKEIKYPMRWSRWEYCKTKFQEFCNRTDLHGFKYIAMKDLSVIERCVWGIAVIISIIGAAFFVITAYRWYARNPIVTVIESTQGAIWDVPFPAVTFCDLNMISKRAARAFVTNLTLPENITSDFIFKTLKIAPLLHSMTLTDARQKRDLSNLQAVLDLNDISVESLFKQLSPASSCSNLIERCMWKNTIYMCEQMFQHVFTGVNLCCAFNYYAVDLPDNELRSFRFPTPRRVASCGYQTALTAILKTDPTDYYSTVIASQGSLVIIDNVYNVPDLNSPVRIVNPSAEVMIAVSPEHTYTTPGIKAFKPADRHCYYSDEVRIANLHHYSFHNCMALRKVQVLINACDCIPFFFPQKEFYRICNFHDVACLENITKPALPKGDGNNHRGSDDEENDNLIKCLPECEHFDYPLEMALGKLSINVPLSASAFYENVNLENRSIVNIFFNDLVATRYRRDVYLKWQNILASFGGLLSLMLGFTLISGFDFVLFFSFKVIYDSITRYMKKEDAYKSTKDFIINVEEHRKDNWANKAKNNKIDEEIKRKNKNKVRNRY